MSKPERLAPRKLVVLAPNWLGDAVMALPLLADLAQAWPQTTIAVAARAAIVPLFEMAPSVRDTVALAGRGGLRGMMAAGSADAALLAQHGFDAALVLPNSFHSAWLVHKAAIPERWGFASDLRTRLLTCGFSRPGPTAHQADYYRALGAALGVPAGDLFARLVVDRADRERAGERLHDVGVDASRPFVACAPGAAYGRAKQWLPERFVELLVALTRDRGMASVLIGSQADRATCGEIAATARRHGATVVDLAGATTLGELAAILQASRAAVSNDSGAMHLAAAVGTQVIAVFGPTDERRTSPLRAGPQSPNPVVLTADVWCRRCMLRECPIDHRCMREVTAAAVVAAIA